MNSFGIGGGGGLLRWIKNELIWKLGFFFLHWMKNELIWNLGGGLLRWIKNELIWNFGGGGILHWIKNELIWNWGGVFYVGSKMNSFGIGGGSFTLDEK